MIMEQSKYYELGNDNTYCVHFSNKRGLTLDEIRKIFTEWGNVVGVTKAGDDYGYRFVRYRNEDEVKRCIEATRSHPTIRLLPKRRTEQSNGHRNRNNCMNRQESQIPWGTEASKNYGDTNGVQQPEDRNGGNCDISGKLSVATNEMSLRENESIDDKSINRRLTNIRKNFETEQKQMSPVNSTSYNVVAHTQKNKDFPITTNNALISLKRENQYESTTSIFSPPSKVIVDEIPDLAMASPSRAKNRASAMTWKEEKIIDAEEIVVANVPTDCSENLILHLFRKYEPICVYPMKISTSLAIRYCIVFFPSARGAIGVESEFDNYDLGGKNLIVLRPQTLREICLNA